MIKLINYENMDNVLSLIKDVYYKTEAYNDTIEGRLEFEKIYLDKNDSFNHSFYGYFINDKLLGVISINNEGYVKCLFVNTNRRGIGTALLNHAIIVAKNNGIKAITLESSIFAHDFYLKNGFIDLTKVIIENGMSYIPMKKEI